MRSRVEDRQLDPSRLGEDVRILGDRALARKADDRVDP
jgi:hypothetical protein